MKEEKGCKYCIAYGCNDAWSSQPQISKEQITSNLNGTLPLDETEIHEGFSVRIKDYGHSINSDEKDIGYLQHIKANPGALEIRSEMIGKLLFPTFPDCPLIIEIKINYCPNCGRKLGIKPKDT